MGRQASYMTGMGPTTGCLSLWVCRYLVGPAEYIVVSGMQVENGDEDGGGCIMCHSCHYYLASSVSWCS